MSIVKGNHAGLGGAGAPGGPLGGGGAPLGSHAVAQSLRFDGSTAYLTKSDFGTATDTSKRTFSTWVKRGDTEGVAAYNHIIGAGSSAIDGFGFQSGTGKLQWIQGGSAVKDGVRELRDTSAWYHFFTTWNATDNELFIYVNGELDYSDTGGLSALAKLGNTGHTTYLGKRSNADTYIHGYLAETVFLDGTIGDINDFGELVSGIWVPKTINTSSITFGNNGFYLPYSQDFTAGNSINFGTGRTAKVTYSDSASFDIGASDDFTIEYFFKTQDVGANYGNWIGDYATGGPHHLISYDFRSSTRDVYFYSNNGQALKWSVAGDVTLSSGAWHHVVFQRDGTVLRAYIDGTRLTSVSNTSSSWSLSDGKATNFNKAYNLSKIILGDPNGQGMSGSLSNIRYVIGDTVYADDDSDITVPTETLTAVTNTKLLTAVNSTLGDDISTENNDGTTSGSPTLSYDSPFTTENFFDDASGNGNDFTANNLSATDVVPDSPTSNFATINSVHRHFNMTFKEGNLRHETATNNRGVVGNFLLPKSGKWYWEHWSKSFNYATDDEMHAVGINTPNVDLDGSRGGWGTGITLSSSTGQKNVEGTRTAYDSITGWAENEGCAVVYDADAGTIAWAVNGGALGSTVSVPDEDWIPFVGMGGGSSTEVGFFNFGQDGTFAGETTSGNYTDANGIGNFKWEPPTDALALCSANLPEPAIGPNSDEQADDYFNTVLYTGNGSTQSITGVGFQPDWVWIKERNNAKNHRLFDSVRGATKLLASNTTDAEGTNTDTLTSFDADGFSLGSNNAVNDTSDSYASWNWKAGGTPTATNSAGVGAVPTSGSVLIDGVASTAALAGTIAANKISANTAAGFSIINYTGNGLSGQTVAHALSSTPEFLIMKDRGTNSNNGQWQAWHKYAGDGDDYGYLSSTAAFTGNAQIIPNGADTVELKANLTTTNQNGHSFIMYAFHSVDGFCKAGSYVGNGSADGTFVYTGFRPAWVMMKVAVGGTGNWFILDSTRSAFNEADDRLNADTSSIESTANSDIDFLSNGFKIRSASTAGINQTGDTHIYLAFAEAPFKYANAR